MEKLIFVFMMLAGMAVCAIAADTRAFVEENGLVVVEIESTPPAGSWIMQDSLAGFTGAGYYTWNKGTSTTLTPAGEGILTYRVKITTPGTYYLRAFNYHDYPADQTLENDCWLRVDGGPWYKFFQSGAYPGYWNWFGQIEQSHGVYVYPTYDFNAGYHTVEFSGRSYRYSISRFHLSKDIPVIGPSRLPSLREGDVAAIRFDARSSIDINGKRERMHDISGNVRNRLDNTGIYLVTDPATGLRPICVFK